MNTLIVSAFAGCGKTWLTEHQGQYGYTICDTDSSSYDKLTGWEKRYLTDIVKQVESAKYDFIFVCQHDSVLTEMDKQGIPYVIVQPDNIIWNEPEAPLRDNSHIKDFGKWINHIKEIYDERTSLHFIQSHQQVSFFTLEMNQYLSDIIEDLYWKKEFHDSYSLRTISTYTPEK